MSSAATTTIDALDEDVRLALEQEALGAELTPDEHEEAAGLVADGLEPAEAVGRVVEGRDAQEGERQPEAEPPEPPPTPEDLERIFASLEKQAEKHRATVRDLAGPLYADLALCPLCQPQAPGFYLHTLPEPEAQARVAGVVEALTGAGEPTYRASEQVERCEDCDGWGKVLSGSRDPNHRTVPCAGCQGTGHKPKLQTPQQQPPVPAPTPPQPTYAGAGDAATVPDAWGRQPGHPHYGILPALVGV